MRVMQRVVMLAWFIKYLPEKERATMLQRFDAARDVTDTIFSGYEKYVARSRADDSPILTLLQWLNEHKEQIIKIAISLLLVFIEGKDEQR